ncbi:hypothetical protein N2152v2_001003 [Parachlorella kessleri]
MIDECSTAVLRAVSSVFAVACGPLLYLLNKAINPGCSSDVQATLFALACALFPLHYFYAFLYYTDVPSLFFTLAAYLATKQRRGSLAAVLAAAAVLMRQTNAVWVVFIVADAILDRCQPRKPLKAGCQWQEGSGGGSNGGRVETWDSTVAEQRLQDLPRVLAATLRQAWVLRWELLQQLWGLAAVTASFAAFVLWNGGVVVGDKAHHTPVRHLVQPLYFALYSTGWLAPVFWSPTALWAGLRAAARAGPAQWALVTIIASAAAAAVQRATLVHPFLLADNRHYTFYLWRRVLNRRWWVPTMRFATLSVLLLAAAMSASAARLLKAADKDTCWVYPFASITPGTGKEILLVAPTWTTEKSAITKALADQFCTKQGYETSVTYELQNFAGQIWTWGLKDYQGNTCAYGAASGCTAFLYVVCGKASSDPNCAADSTGNIGYGNTGTNNVGNYNSGNGNVGNNNAGDQNVGDDHPKGASGNTGFYNDGEGNTGVKNVGAGNTGTGNVGQGNSGSSNVGAGNTGNANQGEGNTGNANQGQGNTGDANNGQGNVGSANEGQGNTGNKNKGQGNTGNGNEGEGNTGAFNKGQGNTGAFNEGEGNTGYKNVGKGNTGAENNGEGNTGDKNTGNGNNGSENTGEGNTGVKNIGAGNTGYGNIGAGNNGDKNVGEGNTGSSNQGQGNSGNQNNGQGNTGNQNEGEGNTGNKNHGSGNTGDSNEGSGNTGAYNKGEGNTGSANVGQGNTGNQNSGNGNTGNQNQGDGNTGNQNIGAGNTGDKNIGEGNTGANNVGQGNTGANNAGQGNTGAENHGAGNTGFQNNGSGNTGANNSGVGNTGSGLSGEGLSN